MAVPYHIHSKDCDCRTITGEFSLFSAAMVGDFSRICQLVNEKGYDPSKEDDYGYTALHLASQNNHVFFNTYTTPFVTTFQKEIVDFLIEKGARVNARACGATPLHRAAFQGHSVVCETLLSAGADPSFADTSVAGELDRCLLHNWILMLF